MRRFPKANLVLVGTSIVLLLVTSNIPLFAVSNDGSNVMKDVLETGLKGSFILNGQLPCDMETKQTKIINSVFQSEKSDRHPNKPKSYHEADVKFGFSETLCCYYELGIFCHLTETERLR